MPSVLRAFAKAMSRIAGPFGAPLDAALSLLDDERMDTRFRELVALIADEHSITRQRVDEILAQHVLGQHEVLLELVRGMHALFNLLAQNPAVLGQLRAEITQGGGTDRVHDILLPLVAQNAARFAAEGVLLDSDLLSELERQFADFEEFKQICSHAGYPRGHFRVGGNLRPCYRDFLDNFYSARLTDRQRSDVSAAIALERPGSNALRRWAQLCLVHGG